MTNLLLGVLFAAVQPELGSLRPQPIPSARILEADGSISGLRGKTAGKAFVLRLDAGAEAPTVSIAFQPDLNWQRWRTDERGIAALQQDFGEPSTVYFVNRDGEAVFKAGTRLDAATMKSILDYCAMTPVSKARDYYSGPARMRARLDGIDALLEPSSVRCSNCHGVDAGGIPRGVIKGTNIRSSSLGNRRSASGASWSYDASSFCTAVRKGIDGSGRILEPGMPRYDITDAQCQLLWNYVTALPGGSGLLVSGASFGTSTR